MGSPAGMRNIWLPRDRSGGQSAGRLFGEDQAHAGDVRFVLAGGSRIVHLRTRIFGPALISRAVPSGYTSGARPGRKDRSGCRGLWDACREDARCRPPRNRRRSPGPPHGSRRANLRGLQPAPILRRRILLSRGRLYLGIHHEDMRMMHDLAIARAQLGGNHPAIFGEFRIHGEVDVLVRTLGFEGWVRWGTITSGLPAFQPSV